MKDRNFHSTFDGHHGVGAAYLQTWISPEVAVAVASASRNNNLDPSEFFRQAINEKLAKDRGIAAAAAQTKTGPRTNLAAPFLTINAVKALLGLDEDDVLELISARVLRWAFDLRGAEAARASVRIFAPSVQEYQARLQGRPTLTCASTPNHVFDILFPKHRSTLRLSELTKQWNTGATHLHNLIAAGLLTQVPGTGDSVNKSPMVTRTSAIAFLKKRQL